MFWLMLILILFHSGSIFSQIYGRFKSRSTLEQIWFISGFGLSQISGSVKCSSFWYKSVLEWLIRFRYSSSLIQVLCKLQAGLVLFISGPGLAHILFKHRSGLGLFSSGSDRA